MIQVLGVVWIVIGLTFLFSVTVDLALRAIHENFQAVPSGRDKRIVLIGGCCLLVGLGLVLL